MTKHTAIHEVHYQDPDTKKTHVFAPGELVKIADEDELARLVGIGAVKVTKDKSAKPVKKEKAPVEDEQDGADLVETDDDTGESDDQEDEQPEAKPKKGKKKKSAE